MDGRTKEVNRVVKGFDSELFAKREMNGAIHIYRWKPFSSTHYDLVFALTDNWTVKGTPREWGLEVILARLRALDLWQEETALDRMHQGYADQEKADNRTLRNNVESFLKDFRRQFARATDGINTSTMEKVDRRRLLGA